MSRFWRDYTTVLRECARLGNDTAKDTRVCVCVCGRGGVTETTYAVSASNATALRAIHGRKMHRMLRGMFVCVGFSVACDVDGTRQSDFPSATVPHKLIAVVENSRF